MKFNKKGQVSSTIVGIVGLVFTVVVGFVLISTLMDASLITDVTMGNTSEALATNLTTGVQAVGNKIPTILLIVAVVFLFGALALLVLQARRMGMFGSGGGF